ncbi:site-specific DNA-methyltransferase [Sulfuritalea sp.]|uniref:site-specific DNA-methyltransferase n=1 Tax=Sulfuritalea sp. TaxID=2480090 RepID=UPI001AD572B0|nr:site-specific DNA-methyltransferase [Sulfuritalea sp.]MBN8474496.1 site-specific DNA-methyltransferase [Sulfuritalea sp.]
MAKKPSSVAKSAAAEADILSYRHPDRRKNNPEVGMVTPATDPDDGKTTWQHDPHLDPSLSWTGKAERLSFEVDTVSLHVHERIDPASILSAARKVGAGETAKSAAKDKAKGAKAAQQRAMQPGLFDAPFESLPLRDAIDFYKHDKGWSNRLVAGDSLLVMNSLLQKEGMAGQVQAIYFDPPYGIKYGSNFQPFVNKRDVKDRKDEDLTQEPEMIKAFRDTWELGIHSYLTYLRDRLLLAKELLSESGSVFVQIGDENLHHVREILDDVFGAENFVSVITFKKTAGQTSLYLPGTTDFIIWYAKDPARLKFRTLFRERAMGDDGSDAYTSARLANGSIRRLAAEELSGATAISSDVRPFRYQLATSQREGRPSGEGSAMHFPVRLKGEDFYPTANRGWTATSGGMERLVKAGRMAKQGANATYVRYLDDFPAIPITNFWADTQSGSGMDKVYVVQTSQKIIERCLLMTTDPGDLVLDPTCGSGTTAYVAEKWGRRWITCDTSRVAVTLAKQRLMTASYDYYELRYPHEGLRGGFIWKTVPHVTLKSIANNPDIDAIYERLHPAIEQALAELNKALKAEAQEWEVPFDFPEGADEKARLAFAAFHAARQAMQKAMDRSIAGHADQETLYDQPAKSKSKLRITGPFSVEAVPFPTVQALDDESRRSRDGAQLGTWSADASIARSGESSRQHQWRDELLKTGIRGKGGQMLKFAELETLPGTKYLHGTGHTEDGQRVVVHFGPEHAALEQRAVTNALEEAGNLFPLPKMIVFCAFTFDPEAAKDIDHLKGITALKAQMNTDLLTEDLKKARSSNQSFWLMGQPDVAVRKRKDGLFEVEVNGFDYFDTAKGELVSGGKGRIAMWSLDTDYDERSLFPHQVFFPLAGKGEGWEKLKKDIRAELDEDALEAFHGTVSLPFAAGDNRKVAVKIVDDRGIESLRVVGLD